MAGTGTPWQPNRILRVIEAFPTGSSVVRVETDAGEGFLKALGNAAGQHSLACEYVGTRLAALIGLPTLTFALVNVTGELPILLGNNARAENGPAFITKVEEGAPWGGDAKELERLDNPHDLAKLVVFDTWTRNCDRYMPRENRPARMNRDNVFLSREGATAGRLVLKAIDHGHCFDQRPELTVRLRDISTVRDEKLYGLFPAFTNFVQRGQVVQAVLQVERVQRTEVQAILNDVPSAWEVREEIRQAWCDFICQRARCLRQIVDRQWTPTLFDWPPEEGQPT